MTKPVIEARYMVGHTVFCTHQLVLHDAEEYALDSVMQEAAIFDGVESRVFPLMQLRVVGVRLYQCIDGKFIAIRSALENVYKVMRNRRAQAITLLTQDMSEVVKVEWPESKPFHDAFGPIEEGKFRQIMYVCALNVDGNYKLIEVLDDQDW